MGLQSRPPSTPPLSAMACLDVESPSLCRGQFKSVLQLCLQQRRTREQLVEQGIMPPLKTPAAFHEKIRSLERARTGSFLKHKLCSRPERSELVRMHILQETQAQPSLQATQMALKRARLTDDLNEKIAQRPGPMELVEKNILAVEPAVKEAAQGEQTNDSKSPDIYSFDEDSGDASSPQRPGSQPSPPGSTPASPAQSGGPEATAAAAAAAAAAATCPQISSAVQPPTDSVTVEQVSIKASPPRPATAVLPAVTPLGSVLVKQSLAKLPADKNRSKRSKEPKPRVKKLKYHQYIPPDQKQELNEVPMDSTYARLLQQQQHFLQLQILSQQQQFGYQPVPPAAVKATTEVQTSCSAVVLSANAAPAAPAKPQQGQQTSHRPDHLPANLDEMKVAELKMELKLRSLPVSGTKIDLIERLKAYQENSSTHTAAEKVAENTKSSPPVSPVASKVSSLALEDGHSADSPSKPADAAPPAACENPAQPSPGREEAPAEQRDSDKDKRLYEKERQIEELMRKLEHEQRLVEELKMQLEVEKRSQQGDSPPHPGLLQVKEEKAATPSSCSASSSPLHLAAAVKQEEADDGCRLSPPNRFIVGSDLQEVEAGARILLAASLPVTVPALIQTSQKIEASVASQQPCSIQPLTKTWRVESATASLLNTFPVSGRPAGAQESAESARPSPPAFLLRQKAAHCAPKSRDPPPYEDAVKQKRSLLTAVQAPSAASQHMDDLFDVLIESGEISPFVRLDPPCQEKPLPVTASVTTLPVNTVLSRPPPMVHMAQLPLAPPTAGGRAEPQTLKLMEELHSSMEVDFDDSTLPSALNLQQDNMDWLDLTLSVPAEGVTSLDMSSPVGVFSSDFLDSHELQLNWE
ncbi:myocardin-related transcription factor B isoform X2 [Nelusetta ayraudi]|uniref:myocardin-related transcription factor B isoform X2 n=1 Tax=Nelusetta ayraudi TaxID=303726 RepID=UPI003F6F8382